MELGPGKIQRRRPTAQSDDSTDCESDLSNSRGHTPDVTRPRQPPMTRQQPPMARQQPDENSSKSAILVALFVIVIAVAIGGHLWLSKKKAPSKKCMILDNELIKLRNEFTAQNEDDWLTFAAGIEQSGYNQASAFTLIYRNSAMTAERLASRVASLATRFLSNCASKEAIVLNGSAVGDNFIQRHKRQLDRSHVMVVLGLEQMNAETASPFHSLCDMYNPAVEKAVFFFTLRIDKAARGTPVSKMAKNRLMELWKTSRDELVSGLVTRLTSNVIEVNEE